MDRFKTRDSSFAAYLITLGFQPNIYVDDSVVWFYFDIGKGNDAKQIRDKYFSGISISAISFANNMKLVKNMVAQALRYA